MKKINAEQLKSAENKKSSTEKPSYTPGPWVTAACNGDVEILANTSVAMYGKAIEKIAHCYDIDNARLIAAAPQLVEVLQFLRSFSAAGLPASCTEAIDAALKSAGVL